MQLTFCLSEHLLSIVASNEESFEIEKQTQKQHEVNDDVAPHSALAKEQNTDSQKTIIYGQETNGGAATQSSSTNETPVSSVDISDLKDILQRLENTKSADKTALYDQILGKVNQLKLQMAGGEKTAKRLEETLKEKCTSENQSNATPEFSPNHSEPMEYYGGTKFSTQSSVEEPKDSVDGMFPN